MDAKRWQDYLTQDPDLAGGMSFMHALKDGRAGANTSNEKKIVFAQQLQQSVPTMTFAEEFVTVNVSSNPRVVIDRIVDQIGKFRREIVATKADSDGTALCSKMVVTGKGHGMKDDLVMALCIAVYYAHIDRCDEKFLASMGERNRIV